MNTLSHIMMGNLLWERMKGQLGLSLHKQSFVLGNVLPDFCPSFLSRPHYLKNNKEYIQDLISVLMCTPDSAYNDKKYSRQLGVLCHFYADFFCRAHTELFTGTLPQHIAYESRLHTYFEKNLGEIRKVRFMVRPFVPPDFREVYDQFEALQHSYHLSCPSLGNDIMYSVIACLEAVAMITGKSAFTEHRVLEAV